jgi:hypothetical protein
MDIYRVQEYHPMGHIFYEDYFMKEQDAYRALESRLQHHKKEDLADEEDCVYLEHPIVDITADENDERTIKAYILEVWRESDGEEPEDDLDVIHLELRRIKVHE